MKTRLEKYMWAEMDDAARDAALGRPAVTGNPQIDAQVNAIIATVRRDGDKALLEFTERFDGVDLGDGIRVTEQEYAAAREQVSAAAHEAMEVAIANVSKFHAAQLTAPVRVETSSGVVCERITRPVNAAGLYVPAGSAPLPSTAIMLAIPARLAECPVRIMCTPPRPDGHADPAVLLAASMCGVDEIYKLGGAHAIAAMAYGTETVPKVEKIYGPGNVWVTAAKKAVATDPVGAALDMPAGPSEIMVLADGSSEPRFAALDLLSQAEHGPDSQAILVSTDEQFADRVNREIEAALPGLPRRSIIEQSLAHGACQIVSDLHEALNIANRYAPEHLILQINNPRQYIDSISNAGSIFLGPWTPEAVGDYCSGTNHVLPTYGFARNYSGLSVSDFQKQMSVQELTREGLTALAPTVRTLAQLEGLDAHAQAVAVRLDDLSDDANRADIEADRTGT